MIGMKTIKYVRDIYPSATLITTNSTWIALGLDTFLPGKKLASNHFSYVTAS